MQPTDATDAHDKVTKPDLSPEITTKILAAIVASSRESIGFENIDEDQASAALAAVLAVLAEHNLHIVGSTLPQPAEPFTSYELAHISDSMSMRAADWLDTATEVPSDERSHAFGLARAHTRFGNLVKVAQQDVSAREAAGTLPSGYFSAVPRVTHINRGKNGEPRPVASVPTPAKPKKIKPPLESLAEAQDQLARFLHYVRGDLNENDAGDLFMRNSAWYLEVLQTIADGKNPLVTDPQKR